MPGLAEAWPRDEKWFNATGADITKIKAGNIEDMNHYVYNPPETIVTAQMVLDQAEFASRDGRPYPFRYLL